MTNTAIMSMKPPTERVVTTWTLAPSFMHLLTSKWVRVRDFGTLLS